MRTLFFLFHFLLFSSLVAEPLHVEVFSEGAVLINAETGAVLFEKNAHETFYPASITKIVTAAVALKKRGDQLDSLVTAEYEAVATASQEKKLTQSSRYPSYFLEPNASHMGIKRGEVLSLNVLLYGLLIASASDAANVIAQFVSGDVFVFVNEMNQLAKEVGCEKTHFENPHGLYHPDQVTTAYEMALIAKEALQIPHFRTIVQTVHYPRPKTNKQEENLLFQTNRLIKKSSSHYYPYAFGVKTGYLDAAKHTLVAAAEKEGRQLIAVLLKAPKRGDSFTDAKSLFEAAFNEEQVEEVLLEKGRLSTKLTVGGQVVDVYTKEDLSAVYYPSEELKVKCLLFPSATALPIHADECVGEVQLVADRGAVISSLPVFALSTVTPSLLSSSIAFVFSWKGVIFLLCLVGFFFFRSVFRRT